ncbi:unnamed protein product [Linum tenue]|uniref:Sulfotransferase n=1 Tax=Linum tenue TaxID=586396 RepID=A0AAV0PJE6_9ROSI|nr:unnamed protein product [Linum tenue]
MKPMAAFRSQFECRNDDVFLASFPKTGTTWLKALCHTILHRHDQEEEEEEEDILTKKNPHQVVPTLEFSFLLGRVQHLLLSPRRRLMHTHLPYSYLPEEAAAGCSKLVYLARNPKDTVVSMWHFYNQVHKGSAGPLSVERAVESFCSGVMPWGPFYEHVLGYWEESKKRPDEVLFLKYEELCREPKEQGRKLASFLGRSFPSTTDGSGGTDDDDEVEKVLWRSSFGRLKELEVNKYGAVGEQGLQLSHTIYFRKGTVGDWKNYLTLDMAQCIDQVTRVKLQGTGLSLDDF